MREIQHIEYPEIKSGCLSYIPSVDRSIASAYQRQAGYGFESIFEIGADHRGIHLIAGKRHPVFPDIEAADGGHLRNGRFGDQTVAPVTGPEIQGPEIRHLHLVGVMYLRGIIRSLVYGDIAPPGISARSRCKKISLLVVDDHPPGEGLAMQ